MVFDPDRVYILSTMRKKISFFLLLIFSLFNQSIAQDITKLDSVYRLIIQSPTDTNLLLSLNSQISSNLNTDPDTCLYYSDMLFEFAEKIGFYRGMAIALNSQGVCLERHDLDMAQEKYELALEIAQQHDLNNVKANIHNNLSIIYSYQGLYEQSLEHLVKFLKIAEEINDSSKIAVALNNIGLRYYELNNPDKAMTYYIQAIDINRTLKRLNRVAINLGNIGNCYYANHKYDSAIIFYKSAIEYNQKINSKYQLEINYQSIAYAYLELDEMDLAVDYINKSIDIATEVGDQIGLIQLLSAKGYIFTKQNRYNEALQFLLVAEDMAKKNNMRALLVDIYEYISISYRELKKWDKAFDYNNLYNNLRDSIQNTEKDKALSQVTEYEREKQAKEIEILEKEAEIQRLKMRRQKILRNSFILFGILLLALAIGLWHRYKYVRRTKNRLAEQNIIIEREREKSDELLLNILPAETAHELKEKGSSDARQFDMVTVLFTDFKGFTMIAEKLSPAELVAEIDFCFKEFDRIISKYGVEKIKTIGDAFMCAGGLPIANKTNPIDVVKAAIEIQQFMQNLKNSRIINNELFFEARLGIHTGPVVAGIVGIKKFAYDIWGDTVNIASRMESSGEVGKINISQFTYEMVKDQFECRYRGKVQAKGKGEIDMYFVEALKS